MTIQEFEEKLEELKSEFFNSQREIHYFEAMKIIGVVDYFAFTCKLSFANIIKRKQEEQTN